MAPAGVANRASGKLLDGSSRAARFPQADEAVRAAGRGEGIRLLDHAAECELSAVYRAAELSWRRTAEATARVDRGVLSAGMVRSRWEIGTLPESIPKGGAHG